MLEVLGYGLPPGLGSHVHWDRRLDSRLAAALMGIQAIKGVEVGDGFATVTKPGSKAHDEIVLRAGRLSRSTSSESTDPRHQRTAARRHRGARGQ